MHYAEYKRSDPLLVKEVVETFPFATIMVNGPDGPIVAQAPITFRSGSAAAGAIEFHLATINRIAAFLAPGTPITVMVHGPGAHVSPTWFTETFADAGAKRDRTAPTYNYLSLVMSGRLELMDKSALQVQIADLVAANEGADGWRLEELAPDLWESWCGMIQLYRIEIASFDLTAKFSPGDTPGDRPGVVAGLKQRGIQDDHAMAILVERSNDSSQSLAGSLQILRSPLAATDERPA